MLFTTRNDLRKQQALINDHKRSIMQVSEDMDMLVGKISSGVKYKIDSSAISILDLAEFKDLDPYIKVAYRRHIVDVLTPAIAEVLNKSFRGNNFEEYLQEHDAEISKAVYDLSQEIRKNGMGTILP
jgi:hypothetical protein